MKKKLVQILEGTLLLSLILLFTYHYDPYSSLPQFKLNGVFLDSYRVIVDISIDFLLGFRVYRLIKRRFDPLTGRIKNYDFLIFIGYTLLITPDLWLFAKWSYFANTYGMYIIIFLSPWLFWLSELSSSIAGLPKPLRLKRIGITTLGIILTIGITWTYLDYLKNQVEKTDRNTNLIEKTKP